MSRTTTSASAPVVAHKFIVSRITRGVNEQLPEKPPAAQL
jgi:hypothetical protein